jgi:hypothetical protein
MGAPRGNRNALKYGRYTNAEKERGRQLAALRRRVRDLNRRVTRMLAYAAAKIDAGDMPGENDGYAPVSRGQLPATGSSCVVES